MDAVLSLFGNLGVTFSLSSSNNPLLSLFSRKTDFNHREPSLIAKNFVGLIRDGFAVESHVPSNHGASNEGGWRVPGRRGFETPYLRYDREGDPSRVAPRK